MTKFSMVEMDADFEAGLVSSSDAELKNGKHPLVSYQAGLKLSRVYLSPVS